MVTLCNIVQHAVEIDALFPSEINRNQLAIDSEKSESCLKVEYKSKRRSHANPVNLKGPYPPQ